VQQAEGVAQVSPIVMFPVRALGAQFGIRKFSPQFTWYISTDVDAFFEMADITWVQGDPVEAKKRFDEGGALVVSEQYMLAHGLGAGGTITLHSVALDKPVEFDIVGVVRSAGLDLAVNAFGIQGAYNEAALNSVFGSREDAIRYYNEADIRMVLVDFAEGADEKLVVDRLKEAVPGAIVQSSRVIRDKFGAGVGRLMEVSSTVALWSLIIACFGVGNLVIAEIAARRHEFGVLRAIGGSGGMLARLVAGQTIVVALVGCVTGTALGVQLAVMDKWFRMKLVGIPITPVVPWDVIAWGSAAVIGAALIAAAAPLWRLTRQQPRDLMAAAM
jgi:putative ABC transport system permease protein